MRLTLLWLTWRRAFPQFTLSFCWFQTYKWPLQYGEKMKYRSVIWSWVYPSVPNWEPRFGGIQCYGWFRNWSLTTFSAFSSFVWRWRGIFWFAMLDLLRKFLTKSDGSFAIVSSSLSYSLWLVRCSTWCAKVLQISGMRTIHQSYRNTSNWPF